MEGGISRAPVWGFWMSDSVGVPGGLGCVAVDEGMVFRAVAGFVVGIREMLRV